MRRTRLSPQACRLWNDQRGATAAIFALLLVPLIGMMGFAIDVGHALQVKHALQASTDAAVLAGAQDISNGSGDPVATATAYSSASGGRNLIPHLTVTASITTKCFTSTGAACAGPSKANGLIVTQQTSVPTYFAKIFGIDFFPVSVTSTAGAAGGKPIPLNVMLVLDTTASMNSSDTKCGLPSKPHGQAPTKLDCALAGVQTLLGELNPSVDRVGLMVFPGLQGSNYCGAKNDKVVAYSRSPDYLIVGSSSDYRKSDTSTILDGGSDLVSATQGGGSCPELTAQGGVGTFYADVLWQAQAELVQTDIPGQGMQNVIVFLSDGDADSSDVSSSCPTNSTAWCSGGEVNNQCHAAIRAAQSAAAQGTWVFSIAYGASTSSSGSCASDQYNRRSNPTGQAISACNTMQNIASSQQSIPDADKFYSDNALGCSSDVNSVSELISIFQTIGQALQQPRLLPNGTS
jgi:Flp pilus assembly protein TadG